jgi:hypothetical protein
MRTNVLTELFLQIWSDQLPFSIQKKSWFFNSPPNSPPKPILFRLRTPSVPWFFQHKHKKMAQKNTQSHCDHYHYSEPISSVRRQVSGRAALS